MTTITERLFQTPFIRFIVRSVLWPIQVKLGIANIWVESYVNLIKFEKTRSLWSNPLSIYQHDQAKLSAIMFNASREENLNEIRKVLEDLRLKVLEAREQEGSFL